MSNFVLQTVTKKFIDLVKVTKQLRHRCCSLWTFLDTTSF